MPRGNLFMLDPCPAPLDPTRVWLLGPQAPSARLPLKKMPTCDRESGHRPPCSSPSSLLSVPQRYHVCVHVRSLIQPEHQWPRLAVGGSALGLGGAKDCFTVFPGDGCGCQRKALLFPLREIDLAAALGAEEGTGESKLGNCRPVFSG